MVGLFFTYIDKLLRLRGKNHIFGRSVVIHDKPDDLGPFIRDRFGLQALGKAMFPFRKGGDKLESLITGTKSRYRDEIGAPLVQSIRRLEKRRVRCHHVSESLNFYGIIVHYKKIKPINS